MKKGFASLLFAIVLFNALLGASQQLGEQVPAVTEAHYNYLVYLPKGYAESAESYPMIFFLHGAGERGSDLSKVAVHGPPKIVNNSRVYERGNLGKTLGDFNFIVISPQCPSGEWWQNEHLNEVFEEVLERHRIDPKRIYMTGLSMGGFGTWSFVSQHPERFAAMAPVSGGGDASNWPSLRSYTQLDIPPANIDNLASIPAWVFHGASDTVVRPEEDQKSVDALREAGGDVAYTVYPGVGHDAWTQTYNNPELYQWFLQHTNKAAQSSVPVWKNNQ